jgi:hypothetical protein
MGTTVADSARSVFGLFGIAVSLGNTAVSGDTGYEPKIPTETGLMMNS